MPKLRSPLRTVFGTTLLVLAGAALTPAGAQTTPGKASAPAARKSMDLRTPPLNHIYSSSALRYILAPDEASTDSATEVRVKSAKYVVKVPGTPGNQLQAIPWALLHPTQAWRVFTPLQEE